MSRKRAYIPLQDTLDDTETNDTHTEIGYFTIKNGIFYKLDMVDHFLQIILIFYFSTKLFPFVKFYFFPLIWFASIVLFFLFSKFLQQQKTERLIKLTVSIFVIHDNLCSLYIYFFFLANSVNVCEILSIFWDHYKTNKYKGVNSLTLVYVIFVIISMFLFLLVHIDFSNFPSDAFLNDKIDCFELLSKLSILLFILVIIVNFSAFFSYHNISYTIFLITLYLLISVIIPNMLIRKYMKSYYLKTRAYKTFIKKLILLSLFINEMGLDFISFTLNYVSIHPPVFSKEVYFSKK